MGKVTCCQVQWPESDPQDLYGRRGEWSCFLVSRCVLHRVNICKQNIENCNKNKSNYHPRQDKMYGCTQAPTCPLWQLALRQTDSQHQLCRLWWSAIQPDILPLRVLLVSLPLVEASFCTSAAPNPQNLPSLALPNAVIISFSLSS